ncbi:MAG: ATP-binding cassette domain-containing protein [Pseudomonadota bacterium]
MYRNFFAAVTALTIAAGPAIAAEVSIGSLAKKHPSVLEGVDLTVENGTVMTLVGESGAGKSTVLTCIGRYLQPDSGAAIVTSPGRGTAVFNFAAKDIFVDDRGAMRSLREEMKRAGGLTAANTGADTGKKAWTGDKEVDAQINRMPAAMRSSIAQRMKGMPRAQQLQMLKLLGAQVGMAQENSTAEGVPTGKTKNAGKGDWPSEQIRFEDADVYVTDPANVPDGDAAVACLKALSALHADVVRGFGMNHSIFQVGRHGLPTQIIAKNGEVMSLEGVVSKKIDLSY